MSEETNRLREKLVEALPYLGVIYLGCAVSKLWYEMGRLGHANGKICDNLLDIEESIRGVRKEVQMVRGGLRSENYFRRKLGDRLESLASKND